MNQTEAITMLHNAMRVNHFALSSEQVYAGWLLRFMRFVAKVRPGLTSEQKIEAFLTALAKDEVAASTQNQAFNATHTLNAGQNPRAIQQAMGHKSLETTMGYLHAEAVSVRSPLEMAA